MSDFTRRLIRTWLWAALAGGATVGGAAAASPPPPPSGPASPNVLLICVDDLRPELRCLGARHMHTPRMDELAAQGTAFTRHFVQAPTCGASRYALLTGRYARTAAARDNGALVARAQAANPQPPTFPEWFREHGYQTVAVGKVSHHPGGLYGANWADPAKVEVPGAWDRSLMPAGPWRHPEGAMHGLARGEIRVRANQMDVFQSVEGPDTLYPDGWIVEEALRQLDALAAGKQPFLLAVGLIRPHLPFGAPAHYLQPYRDAAFPPIANPHKPAGLSTWHGSGEFMKYNRWNRDPREDAEMADQVRKHYAACVSYADALVGRLLTALDQARLRERTVVVLWGDHGWHLGEHAIWGKHSLFEESLRSPLLVRAPGAPAGRLLPEIVETIDLYPTLCDLCGLETPTHLDGRSLAAAIAGREQPSPQGEAVSYQPGRETIRTDRFRLIRHRRGTAAPRHELYDLDSDPGETVNVADDRPELVRDLASRLDRRLDDAQESP